MAGWIKIKLGMMELGLGPGHIVLDGNSAPPSEKGTAPPQFSAHVYRGQTVAHLSCSCSAAEHLYLNSATNLHLTSHNTPCWPTA